MNKYVNFNIEKVCEQEYKLIQEAKATYGIYYEHCSNIITYAYGFIDKIIEKDGFLVISFWGSVTNNLTLALLALLRRHQNLSHLILRQVCESLVLACYSLYKCDVEEFITKDSQGNYYENDKALLNANKWLEKNYPIQSEAIKRLKDMINKRHSHSNLGSTFSTTKYDKNSKQAQISFFDVQDTLFYEGALVGLSTITFRFLNIMNEVLIDYPFVETDIDFENKMKEFEIINSSLLKKHYK
jgi:hypothetical protein